MKRIICLFFVIVMLFGCSADTNTRIEKNETGQTENEISSTASETEEEEILFVSVAEDIEFWSKYSENYTVCTYDWVNDDCFFILLKSKENENFRYLFWETENEKLIDLGEHKTELFLADPLFTRDKDFFIISSPKKIMKIELESFDISYIDLILPKEYSQKALEGIISVSPFGMVAELKDEFTLLLYDILDSEQKKTVELGEIMPMGAMLNQGIDWSFDGRYFSLFVYEGGTEYHQDSTYAVFNSDGEFIRYITGGDGGTWDNDQIWTWSYKDENKENMYIYSLTEPGLDPIVVNNYFHATNNFNPRNGIYYHQQLNEDSKGSTIIETSLLQGSIKPFAKFKTESFNYMPYPSPNGKNIMFLNKKDSFYFLFLDTFKEPD